MSGLAVFGLKFPSLIKYDQNRHTLDRNLLSLYHITTPPSDTYMPERLDEVDLQFLRPAFKQVFAKIQRAKCLENFEFLDGNYLLSLDGTGEFSSSTICYPQCCKKEHKDGSVTACVSSFSETFFRPLDLMNILLRRVTDPFCFVKTD